MAKPKPISDSVRGPFTVRRAAKLSGLTPAMVDYLCRSSVFLPSRGPASPGRGIPKQYSFHDVVMLRVLAKLLGAGISVAKLKTALGQLRDSGPEITHSQVAERYLVTDGNTVFFRSSDKLVDVLA